jgi:histidine phosphotransferase ChpT
MFEVHGDLVTDPGLNLPQPPIGRMWMADQHAGLQYKIHRVSFRILIHPPQTLPQPTERSMTDAFSHQTAAEAFGADLDEPDLTALVGSRLCHDLISPLGAIGNGVELLAMAGTGMSPEMQLIAESVGNASARLKFFRVAFGQSSVDQQVGRSETVNLLADLAMGGRLQFDWQVEGDQPRRLVKMAFLAVLCLENALPWGGVVRITREGDIYSLVAEARRTKPDPALWSLLDGQQGTVSPAQVQFRLLPREALRQSRHIRWSIDETGAFIRF